MVRKSTLIDEFTIHSFVYWITSASAKAILGARLSERRISDFVMFSLSDTLSRTVFGLRKRVFHEVVSFNFYLIYFFFLFLYDVFSYGVFPYSYFFVFSYSSSRPFRIMLPISSTAGFI